MKKKNFTLFSSLVLFLGNKIFDFANGQTGPDPAQLVGSMTRVSNAAQSLFTLGFPPVLPAL